MSDKTYREKLMELLETQLQNGTEDPYILGLTNGIIICLSIYTDIESAPR